MSLFALPAIFLGIFSGLVSDLWGAFKAGNISLILIVIGTLIFAISGTLLYAGLGRVLAGIRAVTISIVAVQMLSGCFRGAEAGSAMAIFSTAMPVGTIICFTTFARLDKGFGWRVPILIAAIIGVVGVASFLPLYKPAQNPWKEMNFA